MPLIKIESRPRDASGATPPEPPRRPRPAPREAKGGVGALALGALVGLALLGGLSLAVLPKLLGKSATGPAAAPAAGGGAAPVEGGAAAPAGSSGSGTVATAPPAGAAVANEFPASINVDYAADHVVARVGGQPLTMRQLEQHVRVARALGSLSGDKIPAWTDGPGMRDLQIMILKRIVDMMLLRQAMIREQVEPMSIPVDQLIDDFTSRVQADAARLDQALAANGASRTDLLNWFELSRDSNTYVQVKLMEGKDPSDKAAREAAVGAWLQQTWQSPNLVQVDFYDPSTPAPGQAP